MWLINWRLAGVRTNRASLREGGGTSLCEWRKEPAKVQNLREKWRFRLLPHPLARELPPGGSLSFVHIWNIILHQISAKISVFFRSIAEEKVSALPKRKLRGKRWIKWGFCEKDFDLWAFLQNQPCISVYWPKVDVRTKLAGSHINSQFIEPF